MEAASKLAFKAAQTYVSVYLKNIIPFFRILQCQLWVTIHQELKNNKCDEDTLKKIDCPVENNDCFGADTSDLGKSICTVKAPPHNEFAELNWDKLGDMSKLLLWIEWLDFYKKTNLIVSFNPDFQFPSPPSQEAEQKGGVDDASPEAINTLMKKEYELLNNARADSVGKYFLNMNKRFEHGWVYKDENGVTQADIPWEILFPSPQYYYNMVNVYNLLKLIVSNAQKTLINSIISQAKNAPDSTAGINAQLLDAASSAGSDLMSFSSSLFKQIVDYPIPTLVERYTITSANFDTELGQFYDNMKEKVRVEQSGGAPCKAADIEINLIQDKAAFIDSMRRQFNPSNSLPLEMALAKKDWELSSTKDKTAQWKEFVSLNSPLDGKFPSGTSASNKMRDWVDFFDTFFSRLKNQGGALTIFTIEDDIIASIKEAYEDWKLIVPPKEVLDCGTSVDDKVSISNDQWKSYLYQYQPYFFSIEEDGSGSKNDDWKNKPWDKTTNTLQRLWLWNDWVYLYSEAVTMGVDMNLSVPDSLMKQFIRVKLPSWLKSKPKNPQGRIKKWMAFWYNAESQAMKQAMEKVKKQKAKQGDKINSKIPKMEKERQQNVINILAKELSPEVKGSKAQMVGPNEDRLVDMAKSIHLLNKSGGGGGGKFTRKYVRDQIHKTEKRIKKSLRKFTRTNRGGKRFTHKSRRRH